jgi:hypothetical protein
MKRTDPSRFAVFILTHGRPDHLLTLTSLRKAGYTGRVVLFIGTDDPKSDDYRAKYGGRKGVEVIAFDKNNWVNRVDIADQLDDLRVVVYARNAAIETARELGLEYLLQLDDDYNLWMHRWLESDGRSKHRHITDMDTVFEMMLGFLEDTNADVVAFSQGGDHIGGNFSRGKHILRKAMNSMFMRSDTPINFMGRINEDVNAYVLHGMRGKLFLTPLRLQLNQQDTQTNPGGLTDIYLSLGTYVKSFYTLMMAPSCTTLMMMGSPTETRTGHFRIHHQIAWDNAVPKIVSSKYKKEAA